MQMIDNHVWDLRKKDYFLVRYAAKNVLLSLLLTMFKKLCLTILLTIINFQFDEKYMFTLFALHLG